MSIANRRRRNHAPRSNSGRIRVLYLTNIPSPYRVEFFDELAKSCDLKVVYERCSASDRDPRWFGGRLVHHKATVLRGISIGSDKAFAPSVIRHLRPSHFDLVVIGGYSTPTALLSILYLVSRRIPFVLNADGGFIPIAESTLRSSLKRAVISHASAWLSTGTATSEYLAHYGAALRRIFIYPFSSVRGSSIATRLPTDAEKATIRAELGIFEDDIIVSVGSPIPRKGFDLLLDAAARLPQSLGFYIVGGPPTRALVDRRKNLGLQNVHFVDFQDPDILRLYYDAADLFCLPTREDIWGLVVNEAMSRALPVITTDRCLAGLELIEDGANGTIVQSDDAEALARAIHELIASDALRRDMAQANLHRAHQYTIEAMAARHAKIFEQLLTGPNAELA